MSSCRSLLHPTNCRSTSSMFRTILSGCQLSCLVRPHQNVIVRNIATTSCVYSGYKRYNRTVESIRKPTDITDLTTKDDGPLPHGKLSSAFPTLETHSQTFNGIRFLDLPIVHVKSTSNNTIVAITNGAGRPLASQSAGTVGFRNARKGTNVAAQAAAIALAGDALRKDLATVRVCLKGIGPGRLPALKALQMSGLNIVSITDTTVLPFRGNRPKKARRL